MAKRLLFNNATSSNPTTPIMDGLVGWFTNNIDVDNKKLLNNINGGANFTLSNTDVITANGDILAISTGTTNFTMELDSTLDIPNGIAIQIVFKDLIGYSWTNFMGINNNTVYLRIYSNSTYIRVNGITGTALNVFNGTPLNTTTILKTITMTFKPDGTGKLYYVDDTGLVHNVDCATTPITSTTFAYLKSARLTSDTKALLIYNRFLTIEEVTNNFNIIKG